MPESPISVTYPPGLKVRPKTLSLRGWLWRYTRLPLFLLFLLFLSVESIVLVLAGKNQLHHQTAIASRLAEMSRLAIQEKSSPLLQAGFDLAIRELGALDAFVCEKKLLYVLVRPSFSSCEVAPRWGYRVIETSLGERKSTLQGQVQYAFVLQVPIFPDDQFIILSIGVSLALCLLGVGVIARLSRKLEKDLFYPMLNNLLGEKPFLINEFENLRSRLKELSALRTRNAINQAVLERNAQVAHDIQSPLTVLLFALRNLTGLSEEVRNAIRSSVKRISAITDDLVLRNTDKNPESLRHDSQNLRQLLGEVFEEKKLEYFNFSHIQWKMVFEELPLETKLNVKSQELKRVLSNLINNAVEAQGDQMGIIELGACMKSEKQLLIWVNDEGRGFPDDFQMSLIEEGYTRGKHWGQGLGLKSASEFMRANEGKIVISSQKRLGSRVILEFCYN